MKKSGLAGVLAGALAGVCAVGLIGPAHAVEIVEDPTSIGEEIAQIANQIKQYALDLKIWANSEFAVEIQALQWAKQQAQYLTQLQQYANDVQMLVNWVHDPSLGGAMALLSYAGLGTLLPVNPLAILGTVNGLENIGNSGLSFGAIAGVLDSLNGWAGQAWTLNHVYTPIDSGTWDSQQMIAGANSIAGTQGGALAAYTSLQSHLAAQPALRDHLLTSDSPKDVADASAQVALEQAWTENQIGQLVSMQVQYDAARDSREQRDLEAVRMSFDRWLAASGTGLQN